VSYVFSYNTGTKQITLLTSSIPPAAPANGSTFTLQKCFWIRSWVRTPNTGGNNNGGTEKILYNRRMNGISEGSTIGTSTTDQTTSGTISSSQGYVFEPYVIAGRAVNHDIPGVALWGDSIFADNGLVIGDTEAPSRALRTVAGIVNTSRSGYLAHTFAATVQNVEWSLQAAESCQFAICDLGRNDLTNIQNSVAGYSYAQLQADLITVWKRGSDRGLKVYQTTILPKSTSTDGYLTTANQTTDATNTNRVSLNTWLRAAAPCLLQSDGSYLACAIGTTGAVPCPYLYGVIDWCPYVETSTGSGIWKASLATTATSTVTSSSTGSTITDTGSSYVSNVLTNQIFVVTSGVSAGQVATITGNTATTISLGTSLTVNAGDSYRVTETLTKDGVHPTYWSNGLLLPAFPASLFPLP
jgi:hypothetical protein